MPSFDYQAFQFDAFQSGAFQSEVETEYYAFQPCVFQADAFQTDLCSVPPEPEQDEPVRGGAVSRSKAPRKRVIVEVDGKEYIVPVEGLQEFLDAVSQKVERVAQAPKKRKARKQKAVDIKTAPVVKVVSAPIEEIALIQRHIDRTNEIMRQVFEGALQRYLDELEDEEALLWLIV